MHVRVSSATNRILSSVKTLLKPLSRFIQVGRTEKRMKMEATAKNKPKKSE